MLYSMKLLFLINSYKPHLTLVMLLDVTCFQPYFVPCILNNILIIK